MSRHLVFLPTFAPWGPWQQLARFVACRRENSSELRIISLARRDQLPEDEPNLRNSTVDLQHLPIHRAPLENFRRIRRAISEWSPDYVWNWCGGWLLHWVTRGLPLELVEVQLELQQCRAQRRWDHWGRQPDRFYAPEAGWEAVRFAAPDRPPSRILRRLAPTSLADERSKAEARQTLRQKLGWPVNAKVVSCIAPLVAASDLKTICGGFDLLACVRDDVYLLIVGEGPLRQALQRRCRTLDCRRRVQFMDRLADIAVLGADVYWNPVDAEFSEGMLTAMSWEVPVVGVLSAAAPNLCRHQQTMLGVVPGQRDQYARWTKFLLERPTDRQHLTRQALELVELEHLPDLESDIFEHSPPQRVARSS